jgi:hypothetical protein
MSLATEKGKKFALVALKKRQEKNKNKKRVDNSSLYAGSPMYFYCITCGGEIIVPESYITRSDFCIECQALKDAGWLK